MGEFAWSAKYSIGNAQIDAEHQRLIELANDIATFASNGEKVARIRKDVFALYDHMRIHFQHEEEYMIQLGYPRYEEHKKLHEGLLAAMNSIMKHSDSLDTLVYRLKRLMHAWVRGHILPEDSRIAPPKKQEETAAPPANGAGGVAIKTK